MFLQSNIKQLNTITLHNQCFQIITKEALFEFYLVTHVNLTIDIVSNNISLHKNSINKKPLVGNIT